MNPLPVVRAMLARNPFTAGLVISLVALAVALGIAISAQERALRQGSARAADRFDILVAAPGSQTDVLLSTVFLRPVAMELLPGELTHQVLGEGDARLAAPLAFGDNHAGLPVVGTTAAFVEHLGRGLVEGRPFARMEEAVVGALVPARLGERLEIHHGHADDMGADADADMFDDHDHDHDHASLDSHGDVTVVGRMLPTGTPGDRAIITPVEYVWTAHGLGTGHPPGDDRIGPPWEASLMPGLPAIVLSPESVTAAYGLRARYRTAESMAFFPAETLLELYEVMGGLTRVMAALMLATQVLVLVAILAGLMAVLDVQRRRFAVLRALGAPAGYVLATVWLYVGALIVSGALLGLPLGWLGSVAISAMVSESTGVALSVRLGWRELAMAAGLVGVGLMLSLVPALRMYRMPVARALR